MTQFIYSMTVTIKTWPLVCECQMSNVVYFDIEE